MAYKITSDCTNCGACEPECPNNAISSGPDIFVINPNQCTECVGFHGEAQCAVVCPVESCVTDPAHPETDSQLIAKAQQLHPGKTFPNPYPSHFKK